MHNKLGLLWKLTLLLSQHLNQESLLPACMGTVLFFFFLLVFVLFKDPQQGAVNNPRSSHLGTFARFLFCVTCSSSPWQSRTSCRLHRLGKELEGADSQPAETFCCSKPCSAQNTSLREGGARKPARSPLNEQGCVPFRCLFPHAVPPSSHC